MSDEKKTLPQDEVTGRYAPDYLGDGVYITTDGYSVWLDLRGQCGPDGYINLQRHNQICLEPNVAAKIYEYGQRVLGWERRPS